jgi:predicted amino acid-binding ACT domain protein/phosphoserine phosphatase
MTGTRFRWQGIDMTKQRLYVVHGMGNDAVGLVGKITTAIAGSGGNVVDLRQDVLHGLFTIYMVVDLTNSELDPAAFQKMIDQIAEDTGLAITMDRYTPVPRRPDITNLLMICIGRDKPGIVSASSEMLGKYNANIEFSQSIAREGVFLMELLTDVSHASIPVDNLKRALRSNMEALNIKAAFQDEHVFIKRKRAILFQAVTSFIDTAALQEILRQTDIAAGDLAALYSPQAVIPSLEHAIARLDGLPLDVVQTVLAAVTPTQGSLELLQTLKVMGYKIALASHGFRFFTDWACRELDLDYAYGIAHEVDDDARVLVGELTGDMPSSHELDAVVAHLAAAEKLDVDDITVLADEGADETLGIRLDFNLEVLLDCFNKHAISRENLIGLLGSFGIPHVR